jgi:predicted GNAT superfamily acetyltransferase
MVIRDLSTLDDFRNVVALEIEVWGAEATADVVPVPIFVVTVKRGAILLGAYDATGRMVGFAYSLPGLKQGRPMQWSHMLGVTEPHRAGGLGLRLKLAQRERTLAQGLDLIEWTYDPLQAVNAHFNFSKLGVVVEEYLVNVYGDSSSPLHAGAPTDRFVAQWWLRSPHVERTVGGHIEPGNVRRPAGAVLVNPPVRQGDWQAPAPAAPLPDAPTLLVAIPPRFTDMLQQAPGLAHDWRLATRDLFSSCLSRGYRVVDFLLDPVTKGGLYVAARSPQDER